MSEKTYAERELMLTRLIDAPRELVFRVWTEPKHMAQWWGPYGFTNPVCKMDVRPGGKLYIVMRHESGFEHPMPGRFVEVVPQERLVFDNQAMDAEGSILLKGTIIVTFEDEGGKTKLTVHARATGLVPESVQMIGGMEQGWTESLERLESYVEKAKAA
jgi:uncharacterized protein YndB with AHSA1/START domain